jgi:hypothetical protein
MRITPRTIRAEFYVHGEYFETREVECQEYITLMVCPQYDKYLNLWEGKPMPYTYATFQYEPHLGEPDRYNLNDPHFKLSKGGKKIVWAGGIWWNQDFATKVPGTGEIKVPKRKDLSGRRSSGKGFAGGSHPCKWESATMLWTHMGFILKVPNCYGESQFGTFVERHMKWNIISKE